MRAHHRPAFSRSELLTCLGLLLGLLGVVLPAVTAARAAAAREESVNNLKHIGLSLHNYADSQNSNLPSGFDDNYFSASAKLLPYLEHNALSKKIDFTKSIDDKANAEARGTVVKRFLDPADKARTGGGGKDPTKGYGPTNYLFNGLVFFHNSKPRFPATFTDGTSNTIVVAETLRGDGSNQATDMRRQYVALTAAEGAKYKGQRENMGIKEFKKGKRIAGNRGASWMDGRLLQGTFLPGRGPNDPRPDVMVGAPERMDGLTGPRSLDDTVNVALGDGSVKPINARKLTYTTWYHALTPSGGEVLGNDW